MLQVFVNIPVLKLVNQDLALLIKIIEKRTLVYPPDNSAKADSSKLFEISKDKDTNRFVKGFSVLPLSKLLWHATMSVG